MAGIAVRTFPKLTQTNLLITGNGWSSFGERSRS